MWLCAFVVLSLSHDAHTKQRGASYRVHVNFQSRRRSLSYQALFYRLRYPVKIWLIAIDYRQDDDLEKLIAVQLSDPRYHHLNSALLRLYDQQTFSSAVLCSALASHSSAAVHCWAECESGRMIFFLATLSYFAFATPQESGGLPEAG